MLFPSKAASIQYSGAEKGDKQCFSRLLQACNEPVADSTTTSLPVELNTECFGGLCMHSLVSFCLVPEIHL